MTSTSHSSRGARHGRTRDDAKPTSVELAAAVLALASVDGATVTVAPSAGSYAITQLVAGGPVELGRVDAELGAAVAERLAALAPADHAASCVELDGRNVLLDQAEGAVVVRASGGAGARAIEATRVAAADELRGGDRIGAYRILRALGRGGMGVVYLAVHEPLRKLVALKLVRDAFARDAHSATRFLHEARATCRVRHRGIVGVTDYGTLDDGRPYLVMEYVEGFTLRQILWSRGCVDPVTAMRWGLQLADALEAVHAEGIVHRDVKPDNVFVDPFGRVRLGDFGAVKQLVRDPQSEPHGGLGPFATHPGDLVGTPDYMAPECARGGSLDHRVDVYALGCVLFELVSGLPPFVGDSPVSVLLMHARDETPRLASPRGPVPAALRRIVARAMAKDPARRYATAAEVCAALRAALATTPAGLAALGDDDDELVEVATSLPPRDSGAARSSSRARPPVLDVLADGACRVADGELARTAAKLRARGERDAAELAFVAVVGRVILALGARPTRPSRRATTTGATSHASNALNATLASPVSDDGASGGPPRAPRTWPGRPFSDAPPVTLLRVCARGAVRPFAALGAAVASVAVAATLLRGGSAPDDATTRTRGALSVAVALAGRVEAMPTPTPTPTPSDFAAAKLPVLAPARRPDGVVVVDAGPIEPPPPEDAGLDAGNELDAAMPVRVPAQSAQALRPQAR